jgi:hypothetical protein
MNTLNLTARLIATITSLGLSIALFSSVVSIAEPQRSVLMAKNAAEQELIGAKAKANAKATVQLADAR